MLSSLLNFLKTLLLLPLSILIFFFRSLLPNPNNNYTREETDLLPDLLNMKYENCPNFFQGTFSEATKSARDQCKFMCVYVHSEMHEETDLFLSQVLCTESVAEFLNDNFVFYAVDVNSVQGQRLNQRLSITNYPFVGLLCNISGSNEFLVGLQSLGFDTSRLRSGLNFIRTFSGFTDRNTLLYEFSNVIEQYDPILQVMKNEQESLTVNQEIMREQDQAYLESLRRDQEKQRLKEEEERRAREEEEEFRRQEEELLAQQQNREARKQSIRETLPEEPEKSSETTTIALRLSDGMRLTRRFYQTDPLQHLFDFAELHEPTENYRILIQFPKQQLTEHSATFTDLNLTPNASVFIEEIF